MTLPTPAIAPSTTRLSSMPSGNTAATSEPMPADAGIDEIDERRRPREHGLKHDEHQRDQQRGRRPRPIDPVDEPRRLRHDTGARRLDARQRRAHPRVAAARLGRERRLGAEQLGARGRERRRRPAARARASARVDQQPLGLDAMQVDAAGAPARDERVGRAAQLRPMRRLARRRQRENSRERFVERREPAARGRDDGKHRHAAERLLQRQRSRSCALRAPPHRSSSARRSSAGRARRAAAAGRGPWYSRVESMTARIASGRGVPATRPNSTSTAICSSADVGLSEYVPGRSMRSSDTPPNVPRPMRRSTVTPG